jgi:hypothetical protein
MVSTSIDKERIEKTLNKLIDYNRDFYITKNNLRLFIKENLDIVLDDLIAGDKIFYTENSVVCVVGYADKVNRKYLKIVTDTLSEIPKVLFEVFFNTDCDLYIKLKKDNSLIPVLKEFDFVFFGGRGHEVLLKYTRI